MSYWLQLLVNLAGAGLAKLIVDRYLPKLSEIYRWTIYLILIAALTTASYEYQVSLNARGACLKRKPTL
jgi:hypothetical protein